MKKIAEVSNQNLVQNSDAVILTQIMNFNGSATLVNFQKKIFNWLIKFLDGLRFLSTNIFQRVIYFLDFLKTEDIINLYFVSKFYRNVVLKVFDKIYFVSTGFCSTLQWFKFLEKSCFALVEEIYCSNWNFDLFDNEKCLGKCLFFQFVCIFWDVWNLAISKKVIVSFVQEFVIIILWNVMHFIVWF